MEELEQLEEQVEQQVENIAAIKLGPITLGTLVEAVVAILVSYIIIHIVTLLLHRALNKVKRPSTLSSFFESAVKIALWALAIIIIADLLGIPTASLLAGVGVVGLALSLSVQNIISNLFSGVTLLVTKPFEAGNVVEISGKMGAVKRVGLFYTVLVTLDNVCISIPNGDVTAAAVTNYSREPIRRVEQFYCAAYSVPTDTVKAAILEAARADDRILKDPAPFASIRDYKDSSIEYVARVWCRGQDYWDVLFALNEHVRQKFHEHGVEMTYNHLNVHLDQ